jgi:mono/diheme cytochrome c family protein
VNSLSRRQALRAETDSQLKQSTKNMKKLIPLVVAAMALTAGSALAADAKAQYEQDCAKCHGADGKGETKMGKKLGAKDYTDAKVQAELKDEAGVKAIKEGLKDKDGKSVMKPTEGISDADAKALVAYMRTLKK